jgi:hypothetical protein
VLTVSRRGIWLRFYVRALLGLMGDSVEVWLASGLLGLELLPLGCCHKTHYYAGLARCANRLLSKRLYWKSCKGWFSREYTVHHLLMCSLAKVKSSGERSRPRNQTFLPKRSVGCSGFLAISKVASETERIASCFDFCGPALRCQCVLDQVDQHQITSCFSSISTPLRGIKGSIVSSLRRWRSNKQ